MVKASLQESAINVNNRTQADFALTGSEGDRVAFADTDIEKAIGKLFANFFELVALAHRGGDDGNSFVMPHLISDRIGRMIGEGFGAAFFQRNRFSFFTTLKRRRSVKVNRIFGGGFVAVAFLVITCSKTGPSISRTIFKYFLTNAMLCPSIGPKYLKTELFEHHAAVEAGLNAFFDLEQHSLSRVAQQGDLVEHVDDFAFDAAVDRIGTELVEIMGHAANARTDRHFRCR